MHREDDGKMGGGEKYAKIKNKAEVQHRGAKWGCNNEFWVS